MNNVWTIEELKTAIGYLMSDLRGSWASNYAYRMEDLESLLEELISISDDYAEYIEDLCVTREELNDPQDGRIFRDECNLYNYGSEEGKTKRVSNYLKDIVEFPEHIEF